MHTSKETFAGIIAFISKHTFEADGTCWEIQCTKEEGVPIRAVWVHKDDPCCKAPELGSTPAVYWSWDNMVNFIDSF